MIFKMPLDQAIEAIDRWLSWARRCRIPAFVKLARTIRNHRAGILTSIENRMSNGPTESVNTKIRLLARIAFGFASPDALVAIAMLSLGGHRPATRPGPLTHTSIRRARDSGNFRSVPLSWRLLVRSTLVAFAAQGR